MQHVFVKGECTSCHTRTHWEGASLPCKGKGKPSASKTKRENTAARIAKRRAVFSPRVLEVLHMVMTSALPGADAAFKVELENALLWAEQERDTLGKTPTKGSDQAFPPYKGMEDPMTHWAYQLAAAYPEINTNHMYWRSAVLAIGRDGAPCSSEARAPLVRRFTPEQVAAVHWAGCFGDRVYVIGALKDQTITGNWFLGSVGISHHSDNTYPTPPQCHIEPSLEHLREYFTTDMLNDDELSAFSARLAAGGQDGVSA